MWSRTKTGEENPLAVESDGVGDEIGMSLCDCIYVQSLRQKSGVKSSWPQEEATLLLRVCWARHITRIADNDGRCVSPSDIRGKESNHSAYFQGVG